MKPSSPAVFLESGNSRRTVPMKTFGRRLGAALLFVLVAGSPLAGQEPEERRPPRPAVVQPGAPGSPGTRLAAEDLVVPERAVHTEADVLFMRNMIHHHHQALVMSDLARERAAGDDIRLLARRIERSQTDEIELMSRWLELRGEDAPDAGRGQHGHGAHRHHRHDGAHATGEPRLMAGMLTPEQLEQLAAAEGPAFDRLFLERMIYHHEGALAMVRELLASPGAARDSDVFFFASHVESDQEAEIRRMQAMLRQRR